MIKEIVHTKYSVVEPVIDPNTQLESPEVVDRDLYLLKDENGLFMEFYKSSGNGMPEEHRKGNIYPILGIVGEGKIGDDLFMFYKGALPKGTFAKHLMRSTSRDGKIANFDHPQFYKEAMELETLEKYNFEDIDYTFIPYDDFVKLLDTLYQDEAINFYPRLYMKKHGTIDIVVDLLKKAD